MHFLNITILLNEKVRTCKQRHCSNHALLWVATKLKHVFTDFLFTKFSKCFNLSQTTFPCLSPLQSLPAPPSLNVTLLRLLLLNSRGLGSTHSKEHLHLVICHVRSFSQFPHLHRLQSLKFLALSELDIHGKESRENMHKDIVTQSLRRQDVSREVISIHDRLQWLHYYIFLDNSYSSRCITKTTGQNVCTILAARCNCPSAY